MTLFPRVAALLVAVAAAAGCKPAPAPSSETARPAASVETPHRKPGLWRQTMTVDPGNMIQSMNLCLDKPTDDQIAWWGQKGVRAGCEKNTVVRQPDGSWRFSSICQMGEGPRTTTDGVAVGDFDAKYQLKAEITVSNAGDPQVDGTRQVNVDGEWLGPCPAGLRPGEAELPGGQRVNLIELVQPAPTS